MLRKLSALLCTFLVIVSVLLPVCCSTAYAVPAVPVEPDGKVSFQCGVRASGQPTISPKLPSYVLPLTGALNYQTLASPRVPNVGFGPYVMTDSVCLGLEGRFYLALQPYFGTMTSVASDRLITYNGFKGGRVIPFYQGATRVYEGDPLPLNDLVSLNSSGASGQWYAGGDIVYFDLRYDTNFGSPVGFRVEYFYGDGYDTWTTGDYVVSETTWLCYHIPIFNYVSSSDDSVLAVVNKILTHVANIDLDLDKVLSAVNMILAECERLNLTAADILGILDKILTTDHSILDKLTSIDTNVTAIYYVLTEALKSETASMDKVTSDTVSQIENQHAQDVYWQTAANQAYQQLDISNPGFGSSVSGIKLVGKLFSDIFSTFGAYQIVFTFPLLLAISLLIIGKISRSAGRGGHDKDKG